jgi:ubiquinone/menaquinone biosynthesis C-methylase UbiE
VLPAGLRVLEIGCGEGDLLHAVKPRRGVGIDFSATAIARAKLRFPEMTFIEADANSFEPLGCVFRAIPDTIPL